MAKSVSPWHSVVFSPLTPTFFCWVLSFALRAWMSRSAHGSLVWAFQGSLRDAAPGALISGALFLFKPRGLSKAGLDLLLVLWTVSLLFLSVSDIIYFLQCEQRLDRSLVVNTSLTSLKPALNAPTIAAFMLGMALLALLGRSAWKLARRSHPLPAGTWGHRLRLTFCALILLGATLPCAREMAMPTSLDQQRTDEMLGTGQAGTIAGIALSLWEDGPAWVSPPPTAPLNARDHAWAQAKGLLGNVAPLTMAVGPRRYRRVVVIAVESLAAAFLDPSNPRRPKGMTPFLDSLLVSHPHLNQCYSAGMDTEQGQYSLMCGRTDFEWDGHRYPGETLFSLARESGFNAEMLYGDTQNFRDKEVAYPATLRLSRQFSRESFLGVLPAQEFCSWGGGLCDHAVLTQALNLLADSGSRPTLLLVDTLDTHPPYYWQKPEAAFPPTVRAAGPLQKSLNQLDDNLRAFFEGLKARGLYDDKTLVVITADHFPAFGSDALALSGAPDHNTNRIPMLFVSKSEDAFASLDQQRLSSQLDLAPTLARLMGLPPSPEFLGRDLLAKGPGRALSREHDLLRLRLAKATEQDILLDDRGRPQDLGSPLARWYRWRLGLL